LSLLDDLSGPAIMEHFRSKASEINKGTKLVTWIGL
jgi:hypothetical protein